MGFLKKEGGQWHADQDANAQVNESAKAKIYLALVIERYAY